MSMKKIATGFGQRLKAIREAKGMTQDALAAAAGLNRNGLAKLEQGVSEPHWPTVLMIAQALGVPCTEFTPATPAKKPARKK
jgi:transcriptional regulator with XRE-family HTH domain